MSFNASDLLSVQFLSQWSYCRSFYILLWLEGVDYLSWRIW